MVSANYIGNARSYSSNYAREGLGIEAGARPVIDINSGIYNAGKRRDATDYHRGNDGERVYKINRVNQGDYSGSERKGASPMFWGGIGEISLKGMFSAFGDAGSN